MLDVEFQFYTEKWNRKTSKLAYQLKKVNFVKNPAQNLPKITFRTYVEA